MALDLFDRRILGDGALNYRRFYSPLNPGLGYALGQLHTILDVVLDAVVVDNEIHGKFALRLCAYNERDEVEDLLL